MIELYGFRVVAFVPDRKRQEGYMVAGVRQGFAITFWVSSPEDEPAQYFIDGRSFTGDDDDDNAARAVDDMLERAGYMAG